VEVEKTVYDVLIDETPFQEIIQTAAIENLYLAVCNLTLYGADLELANAMAREYIIREQNALFIY
jgi:chromosome partitioning protein